MHISFICVLLFINLQCIELYCSGIWSHLYVHMLLSNWLCSCYPDNVHTLRSCGHIWMNNNHTVTTLSTVHYVLQWIILYPFNNNCVKKADWSEACCVCLLETEWDFSQEWAQLAAVQVVTLPPHRLYELCVDKVVSYMFYFVLEWSTWIKWCSFWKKM